MSAASLRLPVKVDTAYATPGAELRLFPGHESWLTKEEVLEAFPGGFIPHERFTWQGLQWRLVKRPNPQAGSSGSSSVIYLAVLDEVLHASQALLPAAPGLSPLQPAHPMHKQPSGNQLSSELPSPSSRPLADLDSDAQSDASGPVYSGGGAGAFGWASPGSHTFTQSLAQAHQTVRTSASQQQLAGDRSSGSSNVGVTERLLKMAAAAAAGAPTGQELMQHAGGADRDGSRHSSHLTLALHSHHASQQQQQQQQQYHQHQQYMSSSRKFTEDLLVASDSPIPMDRYKALIRLMSHLRRQIVAARVPTPDKAASWESHEHMEVLHQIFMVGECLCRFGTADFQERTNSSRAINTKDYATLLTSYMEAYGMVYGTDFINGLPQTLQDEALSVRLLLKTRCEANQIIFNQLIKHVGTETGSQGGGATVINTSVVSAAPVTNLAHNANTQVTTQAVAAAKASQKSNNRLGVIALAGVLGLWILKKRLFGGRGGGNKRNGRGEDSWEEEDRGRRGRWGRGGGGGGSLNQHLSASIRHVNLCNEELRKAVRNATLLKNDWWGAVRRAALGWAPEPPGYEPVNDRVCTIDCYMDRLEGRPPVVAYHPEPISYHHSMSSSGMGSGSGMVGGSGGGAAYGAPAGGMPLMLGGAGGGLGAALSSAFGGGQQQQLVPAAVGASAI